MKIKNYAINNLNLIYILLTILIIQLVPFFIGKTGQLAKLNLAIYLLTIYIPISYYHKNIKNVDNNNNLIFAIMGMPIALELLLNNINNNVNQLGIIDLSVLSVATIISCLFARLITLKQITEVLSKLVISISITLMASTFIELTIKYDLGGVEVGRYLTGNQNITSYILLVSLPLLNYLKISDYMKFIYYILTFICIGFLYKARLASVIFIIYCLYEIIKYQSANYFKFLLIILNIIGMVLIIYLNERFYHLLGNDIYFRILPILRILLGYDSSNLLIGVGSGNFAPLFYSLQNTYPSIEIIFWKDVFIHAHNFLIDRLISGGGGVFALYLIIYGFIVFNYFKSYKTDHLKYIYHAFFIGLIFSLFDIVHNHLSAYILFQIFTFIILSESIKFNYSSKINYLSKSIGLILIVPLLSLLLGYGNNGNHHYLYNRLVTNLNQKNLSDKELTGFIEKFPHYAEIDTINFYYHLFRNNLQMTDSMKHLLVSMNSFNKFSDKRLHFSTKYYSIENKEHELINVYRDIIYKIMVTKKFISPVTSVEKIIFVVNRESGHIVFNISDTNCYIDLPRDIFKQLKLLNSGLLGLKITDESINLVVSQASTTVDLTYKKRSIEVLTEFFATINNYSEPLKF